MQPKDIEIIERIVYKTVDDIGLAISRSFERLEERIDAFESRTQSRLTELEERIESNHANTDEAISEVKALIKEEFKLLSFRLIEQKNEEDK